MPVGAALHLFEQVLCLNEILSVGGERLFGREDKAVHVFFQVAHVVDRVILKGVSLVGGQVELELGEAVCKQSDHHVEHYDHHGEADRDRDREDAVTRA